MVPYMFIGLNIYYLLWIILVMFVDAYTVKLIPDEAKK